jgi:hypothetical protein
MHIMYKKQIHGEMGRLFCGNYWAQGDYKVREVQ